MSTLPFKPAHRLAERLEQQRWLITDLWSEQAVGLVGGEPKLGKSFLALDIAVSVAAGTACLRQFSVPRAGGVLLYAAEDPLEIVRRRLEGICAAAGVLLRDLDIQVITAPTVRLDLEVDRNSLDETIGELKPRLLILDPFVRLHRLDENASGDVARLLAFLRELQRRHGTAVTVVHHSKKAAGNVRAGQALRGSSEFHAWGDSNLYLQRRGHDLTLTVEHRAESAIAPLTLELKEQGAAIALEVQRSSSAAPEEPSSLEQRISAVLYDATRPLSFAELRARCRVRNASLYHHLAALLAAGRLIKTTEGYRLAKS